MVNRTTNDPGRPAWLMPVLIISLMAMIVVSIILGIFLGSADLDAKTVNLLSQGDETATSLGLDVKSIKRLTIIVTLS